MVTYEHHWAVVVVKWSASLLSTLTFRVRIPLKITVFSVKFVFERNENKPKEAGVGPFLKNLWATFGYFLLHHLVTLRVPL